MYVAEDMSSLKFKNNTNTTPGGQPIRGLANKIFGCKILISKDLWIFLKTSMETIQNIIKCSIHISYRQKAGFTLFPL